MLLAFVGVFLFGCGSDSSNESSAETASIDRDLKIAVSIPSGDHGWTAGVTYWAGQMMEMYPGIEWIYQEADTVEEQQTQLEGMLVQQPDALIILCHRSGPLDTIGKEFSDQGVYIVSVDRGFIDPTIANVFLEGDNSAFGRISAQYIVDRLGDAGGNIIIFEGADSTVNTDRVNGAMEIFNDHPEINILRQVRGEWKAEVAFDITESLMVDLADTKIDAIWASDDDMAEAIERALKEAGRDKDIWILGGAGKQTIIARVMEGDAMFPADVTYPPAMIGQGIHLAISNLRDGLSARLRPVLANHIKIVVELVTQENAKDFYFPDSPY